MEHKIKKIMASVLELDEKDIDEKTSTANIEVWDSLRHMKLIMAIEDELGVEIDDEIIGEMTSYKKILSLLQDN